MIKRVLTDYNAMPYCNRETRRKVERHMRKHPGLTFVQAYNQLYHTNYQELFSYDTSNADLNKDENDTSNGEQK